MKNVILYAGLTLTAAISGAFYPSADEPTGCMMLISNPASGGLRSGVIITTVAPDGTQSQQSTKIKTNLLTSRANDAIEAHKVELSVLNGYIRNGWRVLSVTPTTTLDEGTTSAFQTVYLLEKR